MVFITPVYAAGEAPNGFDRDRLVEGIRHAGHARVYPIEGEDTLTRSVVALARPGDLVIGLRPAPSVNGRAPFQAASAFIPHLPARRSDRVPRPCSQSSGGYADLRGRLLPNVSLSGLTWLRVGGPAQVLFTPADEDDLAYFLSRCPLDIPVMVIGVGSNLLARDGGVPGVVIRLARGFNEAAPVSITRIRAGAAVPDVRLAHAASSAGIAGLAFYRGIPGASAARFA